MEIGGQHGASQRMLAQITQFANGDSAAALAAVEALAPSARQSLGAALKIGPRRSPAGAPAAATAMPAPGSRGWAKQAAKGGGCHSSRADRSGLEPASIPPI
jgi:hypothetical protein